MAALTDKDLEQKQEKNAKLREQIADAEAKAAAHVADKSREIEGAALDAETARLEAQLSNARELAKVATVKDGAADLLASVTDQKNAAEEGLTLPGIAVDTNEKNGGNR